MSLLTIAQGVAREVGFDVPNTIVSNTDDDAALIYALANRVGKQLRYRAWQTLQEEGTITTVNGQANYDLAGAFFRPLNDTVWDATNYWQMRGSLDPVSWRAYQSGLVQTTVRRKFRILRGQLWVFPTPSTDGDSLVYEYISKNWVYKSDDTVRGDQFSDDTDYSIISEDLIHLGVMYRFLERRGFAYQEAKDEFEKQCDLAFGTDVFKPILDFSMASSGLFTPPGPVVPNTGYGGV